jgi:hypothetical protein
MKISIIIGLLALLAQTLLGQTFLYSPTYPNLNVVIDPVAGTVGTTGTLDVTPRSWTVSKTVTGSIIQTIPQPFPNPDHVVIKPYTDEISITYSIQKTTIDMTTPSTVPIRVGINSYLHQEIPPDQAVALHFHYHFSENGKLLQTGDGSLGFFSQGKGLFLDVSKYPSSVQMSGLIPTLVNFSPGYGVTIGASLSGGFDLFDVPSELKAVIPEPSQSSILFGGTCLLGAVLVRGGRKPTKRQTR